MKRKKITVQELSNVAGGFCEFKRVCRKSDNLKGWFYRMNNILTEEERNFVLSFKNTSISVGFKTNAPETKYNYIFEGDKCFR